ncbi:hypothetical protein H0H81_008309 [Sphagnurus paluster]|uniref:Altered inheritance of mitochondria protein 41 n=1 Tax=Sphagnurus paluster TaxID=117069 RepID=A0A9P7K615_9AGAR|nr:hypothetical protein H0H81_008309 [Sphagnurus paluster]
MSSISIPVFSRSLLFISRRQYRPRLYSTSPPETTDIRARLMNEVKLAMKSKDATTSTTIRSVLSEVYAADKASEVEKVPSTVIVNILRKAVVRRNEAAIKFTQAARPELAKKELRETEILSKFLPPLLSETEIDQALAQILATLPATADRKKSLGVIFKEFYSQVDKSTVDPNLVKRRADVLLIGG